MEKIIAKFIGQDERLDYLDPYTLEIKHSTVRVIKDEMVIVICPYESLESFFKNWKVVY